MGEITAGQGLQLEHFCGPWISTDKGKWSFVKQAVKFRRMNESPAPHPGKLQRELGLGKILACCAVASLLALFLAVATAVWQQNHALEQGPQSLAVDAPR